MKNQKQMLMNNNINASNEILSKNFIEGYYTDYRNSRVTIYIY